MLARRLARPCCRGSLLAPPRVACARALASPRPFARPFARPLASASSPSPPSDKKTDEKPEAKPSRWQQIKTTFREHGPVFVGYYATTYAAGFGVCWTAVSVVGLDGVALLQYLGVDQVFDTSVLSARVINALIAAEINEMFDIVRVPFVIATTPALSRRLRGSPSKQDDATTSPPGAPSDKDGAGSVDAKAKS